MDLSKGNQGGEILEARDHGTIWELVYRTANGSSGTVYFDHRCFAQFYEGAVGSSFYEDYGFGQGREFVSSQLQGLRIAVEGDPFNQAVRLLED